MPNVTFLLQKPYSGADKAGKKILNPEKTRIYAYLLLPTGPSGKGKDRSKIELSKEEKKQKQKERNKYIIKIKTDFTVFPEKWDFKRQLMKGAGAPDFNRRLLEFRQEIDTEYDKLVEDPAGYNLDQIKALMKDFGKGRVNPFLQSTVSFFEVYDEFLTSLKPKLAYRTVQKFDTLKATLKEISEANPKYQHLNFNQINYAFLDDFLSHLMARKPRGRQKTRPEGEQDGLLTDTTGKYVENLKSFLKWAEERGYNKNLTYREFKMFSSADKKRIKRKNDIVTLTAQELRDLYTHEFPLGSTLDRVRDLFCFGCYTGQRWGDISRFKKSDLEGDVWTFVTDKTKEEISVDLVGYAAPALDILKKYDYKLPQISLQKFNLNIKKAAEAAGINTPTTLTRYVGSKEIKITNPKHEFIGSHCARRTCVSLLLNVYGVPVTTVQEITGHKDLKTIMLYINKDRAARREKMSKTTPVTEPLTVKKNVG